MKAADYWRTTTFRLTLLFGAVFLVAVMALLGLIYWRTAGYMTGQTDLIIRAETRQFLGEKAEDLPDVIDTYHARDARHINLYGLFSRDGRWITGNVVELPAGLPADRQVHVLTRYRLLGPADDAMPPARALATTLPWGEVLVVGRDITQLQEIRRIIARALVEAGLVIVGAGLLAGYLLSRRPLRRVGEMRAVSARVAAGELAVRLPVTSRGDELDMLALTVNRMLGEIERLLAEVKSVCDNIAHDLRTPMTRLRARLYRLHQEMPEADAAEAVAAALEDTDAVLARFKALLRISEIEDRQRRAAFTAMPLLPLLQQVAELYRPLAEDQGKSLRLESGVDIDIEADPGLLFEAVANLVDNAIKFSAAGGEIVLRLYTDAEAGPCLEIVDHGPGIPESEREAVLQRFYRTGAAGNVEGSGLGLSIVSAIVRLHCFRLEIRDAEPGTCIHIELAPDPFVEPGS